MSPSGGVYMVGRSEKCYKGDLFRSPLARAGKQASSSFSILLHARRERRDGVDRAWKHGFHWRGTARLELHRDRHVTAKKALSERKRRVIVRIVCAVQQRAPSRCRRECFTWRQRRECRERHDRRRLPRCLARAANDSHNLIKAEATVVSIRTSARRYRGCHCAPGL